ncbi:aminoglycoside phosphotransferase family protein [Sciscionella sediminilitoris]|uniref:aminoglycoside phosphotransferase family protein n=1 Tax=Sciscionella sediminilitoris TaxID=1445613 RepID=UPI0004DFABD2|nr:aminoglycoside phosphotransferase family protein [Sciscionella sp. SE31]
MAEFGFERDLVRALVAEQHPDLAGLELREVPGGWGNQQWRLGPELAVRLPRTERAPYLLRIEQRWLPGLAERLPLPTPVPVRVGEPSDLFEHTWTITRWVDGEPADRTPITCPGAAETLAEFLAALHREAPAEAPVNPTRSGPMAGLQDGFDDALEVIAGEPESEAARAVWAKAVAAPVWLHNDLHPANVIVRDRTLAGVIDFGDVGAGDPAVDLAAAWVLLPAGTAERFFDAYPDTGEATRVRARGWAVLRALLLIRIGRNGRHGLPGGKPSWEPAGRAALERALTGNQPSRAANRP